MKTALDKWLALSPMDDDMPERRDHESTRDYYRRWWFYWSTKDGEKARASWGKGVVKK